LERKMLLTEPWLCSLALSALSRASVRKRQQAKERENTEMARVDSYKLLLNHLPACWLVASSY
jgi:hypothetical protein